MNKIYGFLGPHAAGVSTMLYHLEQLGIPCLPCYTTMELGKTDEHRTFLRSIEKSDFLRHDFLIKSTYKGSYVGILKSDILNALQKSPVSICWVEPSCVKQFRKLTKENFESIFFMCDYVTLVERMLRLGHTNEEIKYHLEYAENNNEYDSYKFTNHIVKNVTNVKDCINQILAIMGLLEPFSQQSIARRLHLMANSEA